jgi:hypothetical protein
VEDFFREYKIPVHHVKVSSQIEATLESLVKPIGCNENDERKMIEQRLKAEKESKQKARV